jgi:broad specificity phosphatase PhoE
MILLRHGQSEFNLHFSATRIDPGIVDPPLTALGHQQATQAATLLAGENVSRIICSPYTRALQTAAPIAAALGVPVRISSMVRERYAFVCDVGRARGELARHWPEHDFSHLDEIWWPTSEEAEHAVVDRAARFRGEMAALPDWHHSLVISHWGFILALSGRSVPNGTWLRFDPTQPAPDRLTWKP